MDNLLGLAARIERRLGAIYSLLAGSELDDKELQTLWFAMARDEEDHASQLSLGQRLGKEEVFRGKSGRLNKRVMELLDSKVMEWERQLSLVGPSRRNSLKLALVMEGAFRRLHLDGSVAFSDPSLRKMFAALAREDEKHLAGLRGYLRSRPELRDLAERFDDECGEVGS